MQKIRLRWIDWTPGFLVVGAGQAIGRDEPCGVWEGHPLFHMSLGGTAACSRPAEGMDGEEMCEFHVLWWKGSL